ncbi:hypothetical protein B0H13DRAFT_1850544 [Mycena leptocephala]|nr:hypothetical protein B0H13DRAFT_1850544 [Mycena leptocephala]
MAEMHKVCLENPAQGAGCKPKAGRVSASKNASAEWLAKTLWLTGDDPDRSEHGAGVQDYGEEILAGKRNVPVDSFSNNPVPKYHHELTAKARDPRRCTSPRVLWTFPRSVKTQSVRKGEAACLGMRLEDAVEGLACEDGRLPEGAEGGTKREDAVYNVIAESAHRVRHDARE